jgi:phage terminase large subunit-like protein
LIGYAQDPASAGVAEAQSTARFLDGFNVRFATATGSKEVRAKPISAQVEAGNVKLVRGLWNDEFLRILENFPTGKHDDEVDALSGAHALLCAPPRGLQRASDLIMDHSDDVGPKPWGWAGDDNKLNDQDF